MVSRLKHGPRDNASLTRLWVWELPNPTVVRQVGLYLMEAVVHCGEALLSTRGTAGRSLWRTGCPIGQRRAAKLLWITAESI